MSHHPADNVLRMLLRFSDAKFFKRGWGARQDAEKLWAMREAVMGCPVKFAQAVPQPSEIVFVQERITRSGVVRQGYFKSPLATLMPGLLPEPSEVAWFQLVLPHGADSPEVRAKTPMVVQLAGTGDHGFWRRRTFIASPLLKETGIGSIILENPYYGLRKPKEQQGSRLNYLVDLFNMGVALAMECNVLLRWCEHNNFGPLGLTGLSLGGHMSSLAACMWPKPVALIPCLSASTAAGVFTKGILKDSVAWENLNTKLPEARDVLESLSQFDQFRKLTQSCEPHDRDATATLYALLEASTYLGGFPKPACPEACIVVCAKADGYIPRPDAEQLATIWPGCEFRYVDGGHISSFVLHQAAFRKAIKDAFGHLKAHLAAEDRAKQLKQKERQEQEEQVQELHVTTSEPPRAVAA
eukprot:m.158103 g.158103  ORF g.158103 m.158103 type:complete len:412 (-) comp17010_c3_seq12:430-1665(-)